MICVDASIAVKWVVLEHDSTQAVDLLNVLRGRQEDIVAPATLISEVANVLRQRVARGLSTPEDSQGRLHSFLSINVRLIEPIIIVERALELANRYELPTVYDALYLAVADLFGCELWTADLRMIRTLRGRFGTLRTLDDLTSDE